MSNIPKEPLMVIKNGMCNTCTKSMSYDLLSQLRFSQEKGPIYICNDCHSFFVERLCVHMYTKELLRSSIWMY